MTICEWRTIVSSCQGTPDSLSLASSISYFHLDLLQLHSFHLSPIPTFLSFSPSFPYPLSTSPHALRHTHDPHNHPGHRPIQSRPTDPSRDSLILVATHRSRSRPVAAHRSLPY